MKEQQLLEPVLPGQWLGLLGGGQLGRMFCHAAQAMGYQVMVLDPDPECCAGKVADRLLCAAYDDRDALKVLAQECAAVTTEFENVPADSLAYLATFTYVSPDAKAVAIAQNRIAEKQFFVEQNLAVVPFLVIESRVLSETLTDAQVAPFLPGLLKTAQFGYDGKGQVAVDSLQAIRETMCNMDVPCVLEKKVDLAFEVSLVVARARDGTVCSYALAENQHEQGILAVSTVPTVQATAQMTTQAKAAAEKIVRALDYVGVLCVEFFVLQEGVLIVNEMAPRPHNSGHYTMDACDSSQFEQQVRTLAGLALGSTRQHSAAVMLNLLGDVWYDDSRKIEPNWLQLSALFGAHLHLYGKVGARLGRKMGHVNCVAEALQQARDIATQCARILNLSVIKQIGK